MNVYGTSMYAVTQDFILLWKGKIPLKILALVAVVTRSEKVALSPGGRCGVEARVVLIMQMQKIERRRLAHVNLQYSIFF